MCFVVGRSMPFWPFHNNSFLVSQSSTTGLESGIAIPSNGVFSQLSKAQEAFLESGKSWEQVGQQLGTCFLLWPKDSLRNLEGLQRYVPFKHYAEKNSPSRRPCHTIMLRFQRSYARQHGFKQSGPGSLSREAKQDYLNKWMKSRLSWVL